MPTSTLCPRIGIRDFSPTLILSRSAAKAQEAARLAVCLFVCLFHGVPEVRGGRRLTKDGPYATRRQAEAVLFVRRKPTPPFAGCQGNLLFRGSRGLQTGRPVDHRPYSARHVGLNVESFWNNKDSVLYKGRELRLATDRHAPMATNWFGE